MDMNPMSRRKLAQVMQVKNVVPFVSEAEPPINCPLNNVGGYSGDENTQAARHNIANASKLSLVDGTV